MLALASAGCGGHEEPAQETKASAPPGSEPAETITEPKEKTENEGLAREADRLLENRLGREGRRIRSVRPGKPTGDLMVVVSGLGEDDQPIAKAICTTIKEPAGSRVDDVRIVGPIGQEIEVAACAD